MIRTRIPHLVPVAGSLLCLLGATATPAGPQMGLPVADVRADDQAEEDERRDALYDELKNEPRETPTSRVVRAVTPAVVFVETEMRQTVSTIFGARERTARGAGSGVVIHPSGLIVTNYHVVEGANQIQVSFEGEPDSRPAELMSFVREEDLALLKIRRPSFGKEPGGGRSQQDLRSTRPDGSTPESPGALRQTRQPSTFPSVRLGSSSDLMPGERVVAIGSPHGQTYTVSTGIISGLRRNVAVPSRRLNFSGLIQTDASINLGNSGGPLLNIHGELIGINTIMNSSAENIGFAIPVDRVRQVLDDILFPNARKVWFGFETEERGGQLFVTGVSDGGPAAGTGICEGARLVSLNGVPLQNNESYLLESLQLEPGEVARVRVAGADGEFDAVIETWDELNGQFFVDIGIKVSVERVNNNQETALMVMAVRPGSSAEDLGLEPGDIIPAVRPRTHRGGFGYMLVDKGSLRTLLDRTAEGTEIEVDAYRDLNQDGSYHRGEQLKGVLIR